MLALNGEHLLTVTKILLELEQQKILCFKTIICQLSLSLEKEHLMIFLEGTKYDFIKYFLFVEKP